MIAKEILIGLVRFVPHCKLLGIRYEDHGENWALFRLPYAENLVGYPETGVIAGGAIYTLLDNSSGGAVACHTGTLTGLATLDLRVDYLKPATPHTDIFARVECYKMTRSVAFTRGVAFHETPDRPIAHSSGTFMLAAS